MCPSPSPKGRSGGPGGALDRGSDFGHPFICGSRWTSCAGLPYVRAGTQRRALRCPHSGPKPLIVYVSSSIGGTVPFGGAAAPWPPSYAPQPPPVDRGPSHRVQLRETSPFVLRGAQAQARPLRVLICPVVFLFMTVRQFPAFFGVPFHSDDLGFVVPFLVVLSHTGPQARVGCRRHAGAVFHASVFFDHPLVIQTVVDQSCPAFESGDRQAS